MGNKDILEKIKKCLALSKSVNENEAAIALKQARVLMDKYGIDETDVAFSDVKEETVATKKETKPPQWNAQLSIACAEAFNCKVFFDKALFGDWSAVFVGVSHSSYLAGYAYEVLLRQLTQARKDYYAKNNKRCKRATRIYRADLFAEGYVSRLYTKIKEFSGNTPDIVEQYMASNHDNLSKLKHREQQAAKDGRAHRGNDSAFGEGWRAGKDANLHQPVAGTKQGRLT